MLRLSRLIGENRPASRARRAGLSLLEVAIAMAIFVIGAIALLRIFPPGLTAIEDSSKRLIGSRMANNLLTRYDAEPLSIPDAIFDAKFDNGWNWNDYPGAMLPAKTRGQSLPRTLDGFDDSALGHLRFVRGEGHEIQGPFSNQNGLTRVLSSFVVDRARADVYREGAVAGVGISANGELDFAGAVYAQSNRGDRAISSVSGVSDGNGVGFHEPIVEIGNPNLAANLVEPETTIQNPLAPNTRYTLVIRLQDLQGVSDRAAFYGGYVARQNPGVSFSVSVPLEKAATPALGGVLDPLTSDFTLNDLPGGQPFSPDTRYDLTFNSNGEAAISVEINNDVLPEDDEYFYINLFGGRACSVHSQRILCRIPGNDTRTPGTLTDPSPAPPLVAVRPPLEVRASGSGGIIRPVVFLASYNWNGGGARLEPLTFPVGDDNFPQSCDPFGPATGVRPGRVDRAYWSETRADPQIYPGTISLRFRQFLATAPVENGTSVALTNLQVQDVYAPNNPGAASYSVAELKNVFIDYNVYDWRYMTESVTQFSTPYPGNAQQDPQILGPLFGFGNTADMREVRLPVDGLLGPVYTINVYQQTGNQPSFDARTLDYRTIPDAKQRVALKTLFKQGRLLTSIRDSGPNAAFRFNAYYRTADGWAQQIGATASRYLPWRDPAQYEGLGEVRRQISEPWREYVLAGGRLYFHPSEAGKTVGVQTTLDGGAYNQIVIDDRIVARPASVPAAFAPSGQVAVSTSSVSAPVYDVAALDVGSPGVDPALQIRARAGLQGRTVWTNGDVYQQQFAP